MSANNAMFEGYLHGLKDDRDDLPAQSNFSESYLHGWKNGRDDRNRKPRNTADQLRKEAEEIIISETLASNI